jgi:hypothetical protein
VTRRTSRHRKTVPAIVRRLLCGKAIVEPPCHTHLKSSSLSYSYFTGESPYLHQTLTRSLFCFINQPLPILFDSPPINQPLSTSPLLLDESSRLHQTLNRSLFCFINQPLPIFFDSPPINQPLLTPPPILGESPRLHQTLNRSLFCLINQSLPTIIFGLSSINQPLSTSPLLLGESPRLHQTLDRPLFYFVNHLRYPAADQDTFSTLSGV